MAMHQEGASHDGGHPVASPPGTHHQAHDGSVRFQLSMQKSRLAVYVLAGVVGSRVGMAGVVNIGSGEWLALVIVPPSTAVLFHELYRRGFERRSGIRLVPFWMASDIIIISAAIYFTGGIESPFFIWYLANASSAAFVGGRRGALLAGVANTVAYFLVLIAMGQIRGLDASFWRAACNTGFLYGASFFFLRATANFQEKQRLIKRLQAEQEEQLGQLVSLTQDLDQGTRALADANIQIREADRMKSQFLANMSHELRTPLNSIIGFSEILIDRLSDQVTEKHLKFLNNIHSSGQHLLGIINDVLDLSKVEAGKMEVHPEELRVRPVVDGVLNVMHGMASKRFIGFEVDCPEGLPPIQTDAAKFKQILYNLLSNAVKFSPERATVWAKARQVPAAQSPLGVESLTVSVIDEGIGIAPADQELIFHEFRQADGSATRQFGGTGLGLSLVKKFVELQGGVVILESEVGKGSTFSVTLPRYAKGTEPEPAPPHAPPAPQATAQLPPVLNRILVVEDDAVAFQTISRSLTEAGYSPVRAKHGEEALELARSLRPTAITLDLALPGLSGWDVLRELKRDPLIRDIPVVIISLMDNRELGITLGADDYFQKPVDRPHLVARLREIAPPSEATRRARLLLIDDEPAIHELLGAELSQLGYAVDHAYSGGEGLDMASRTRPDAVILDLMMPDATGFEVAAALREREETAHVPIVVLTAKDLSANERDSLQGKIEALVQKGHGTSSRLVAAIQELESRHPRESAGAR